jgi:hypothetical protein
VDGSTARRLIPSSEHEIDKTTLRHTRMSTTPVVSVTTDSWPSLFAHPRTFNRESENASYLAYLDEIHQGDYESDSGSESSDSESSDSESSDQIERDGEEDGGENPTLEDQSNAVNTTFADDLIIGPLSPVRRFNMMTVWEEAEYSVPLGGDDAVADFVENAMATRFKDSDVGDLSKSLVALIDVESKTSVGAATRQSCRQAKPFRGGLTRAQLRTELAKPVSVSKDLGLDFVPLTARRDFQLRVPMTNCWTKRNYRFTSIGGQCRLGTAPAGGISALPSATFPAKILVSAVIFRTWTLRKWRRWRIQQP